MPTPLVGLTLFIYLLIPGLVYNSQLRKRVPLRATSPLVEAGTLATVSLATNAIALTLFGLYRLVWSSHSPEPRRILGEGLDYTAERLGYVSAWTAALLFVSCGIAFWWGTGPRLTRHLTARFAPTIVDVSGWYQIFEEASDGHLVYVGCDMHDGAYLAGYLDWYSTEVEETADRDLALAAPITLKRGDGEEVLSVERVLVSARDIVRMFVAYVVPENSLHPREGSAE